MTYLILLSLFFLNPCALKSAFVHVRLEIETYFINNIQYNYIKNNDNLGKLKLLNFTTDERVKI